MLRTTRGCPVASASRTSVLAVGSCSSRRSSAKEPQLMVMPAQRNAEPTHRYVEDADMPGNTCAGCQKYLSALNIRCAPCSKPRALADYRYRLTDTGCNRQRNWQGKYVSTLLRRQTCTRT